MTAPALSPAQHRSIVDATARINLWEGSIRSGKTIASLLAFLEAVATAPAHGEVVVVGRTRDSISRNVFGPLQDPGIFGPFAAHVRYTNGAATGVILGRQVHVIGANDAKAEPKIRGLTACLAYVDEATVIPERFFRQTLGRLSTTGARMLATTNPDSPSHWLRRDFILRAHELDMRVFHFTLDDNLTLDPDYVASLKREFTGLWYRRFILGHWVQAEGAVFDMFDPGRHVVTGPLEARRLVHHAAGVDYGTRNPFAALMLAQRPDGRLVLTREYRHDPRQAVRQLTDADYSTALREWLVPSPPRFVVVDPSAASFKLQLHDDGLTNVTDADNAVSDGIRRVASLFARDQLQVHESCTGLLDELPGYSWDEDAARRGEPDRPVKADDHSVDAMRYAVNTTRQLWGPQLPMAAA